MSDQPSDQPDQPMEDAAPADAAPPPPSPADVILQRAQRNSRGVDREAEAAEQRWASLGGGSALGDGTNEPAGAAAAGTTPRGKVLPFICTNVGDESPVLVAEWIEYVYMSRRVRLGWALRRMVAPVSYTHLTLPTKA